MAATTISSALLLLLYTLTIVDADDSGDPEDLSFLKKGAAIGDSSVVPLMHALRLLLTLSLKIRCWNWRRKLGRLVVLAV
jgi:hypothetical protein